MRFFSIFFGIFLFFLTLPASAQPPRDALQYQRDLTREARAVWGINAPVATMAAQIHQESSWRAHVSSPYAHGLTQFTHDTATWISGVYRDLGPADVFNPQWSIRAMVRYNRHIYDRQAQPSATDCDRWAFTLSGYNGGPGWVNRDRRLAEANGDDPTRWWCNVEHYSARAEWAFRENRGYPRRIIYVLQGRYMGWGPGVCRAG